MRRREFITLLGGAAAGWPLTARAQQAAMPLVAFINSGSTSGYPHLVVAFRQGLKEVGYVEGQNVTVEYRWAEGQFDRVPVIALELVSRGAAVPRVQGWWLGDVGTRLRTSHYRTCT